MVLVDTSVWSLALRRKHKDLSVAERVLTEGLRELIREGRAQLVGPVGQELLSGVREESGFRRLRDYLRAFDNPQLAVEDYEEAARMSNACRSGGVAGSPVDLPIFETGKYSLPTATSLVTGISSRSTSSMSKMSLSTPLLFNTLHAI